MSGAGTTSAGLALRPLRFGADGVDPDDLAAAAGLVLACDLAVLGEPDSGADDVGGMLASPTMDRDASCLVLDDDRPVGLLWVEADSSGRETFVDVYAPPGEGSRAVTDLLLDRGLAAARRHRDEAGGEEWTVRSGCFVQDAAYAEALAAHGLRPVRSFYRMRVDSGSPAVPTTAPPLPDGVELVVRDDDATRRRIHAVDMDSFAEHYNFVPRGYDEWWEHHAARPTRDPDGWWLLTVDGEDAAVLLLDDSRADVGDGYVLLLGVRSAFRGRGLGRLLLQRAFVHERDRGRAGTQLGVDAENATGAVRLYESVGMTAIRVMHAYARPLDAPSDVRR